MSYFAGDAQEILARPPEREKEEDGKHERGDLTRVGVEATRDERRAD